MKQISVFLLVSLSLAFAADNAPLKPVPAEMRWHLVAVLQKTTMQKSALDQAKDVACQKDPDCSKVAQSFATSYTELQSAWVQAKKDLGLTPQEDLNIDLKAPEAEQVKVVALESPKK